LIDEIVKISYSESIQIAQKLARVEGILAGISSGAALCAALKIARKKEHKGKVIEKGAQG